MTLLLGAVVLALLAAGFVVYPLIVRRWGLLGDVIPGAILEREARKRAALAALKEVEYDRMAGKLDDPDYQALRTRLEMEALQAIQAIERETAAGSTSSTPSRHTCGFTNPAGSRFCSGCGRRLS